MAGVASPMMRRARANAVRFLAGLTVGSAVGGLVLALPVYLLGTLAGFLPAGVRVGLLIAACAGFGLADFLGRTPHVWRQVPQRFVHMLKPGTLGVVWGFDLGLLFTTQKTTSLIWVAGTAVILLRPDLAAPMLVGIATLAMAAVVANTLTGLLPDGKKSVRWLRYVRWVSGTLLLAMPVVLLATGLPG